MSTILYLNGTIYTLNAKQPRAQALAIDQRSGEILAVGGNDEVRKLGGHNTELVDLRGRAVIPGMIDAHMHLVGESYRAYNIEASACNSEDEVAELVRQRAAQTPEGQWIRGSQWYKDSWPGQRFPSRASLDAAAPRHPVALWSKDGHLLWANSRALEKAGITTETPDPEGGAILRDGAGEPTGVLQEGPATSLVTRMFGSSDPTLTRQLVKETLRRLQRSGITSIHEIEDASAFRLLQDLRDEGELGVRAAMLFPRQKLAELRALGMRAGFGDDMLRLGGIKIFADGTLGSQTAAMLDSFENNPGNRGILTISEHDMNETVGFAAEMGISVAIHAIGDRAVQVALNSIELAQRALAAEREARGLSRGLPNLRYRVEHVQLISPEDLARMKRLGVIASVQPFHAVADRDLAEQYWGKRHRRAFAYRTMQDMGIPLALGSDAPVETFDPLRILYAASKRNDTATRERPSWLPDQALPLNQALWDYTMGAAYAVAEEGRKGSLEVGKLGDAVVLREDLFTAPPDKLPENGVQATILGGKVVYGEL